jgi:putative integral membrane protein (TIGR02587 family)
MAQGLAQILQEERLSSSSSRKYIKDTSRAGAGALIFAFPLLMTMEMWELGFYMEPVRLLIFLLVSLPMLVGLSHYSGFEDTFEWREDVMDALTAFAVGIATSASLLVLLAIIRGDMPWEELVGKVAVQAVPASIGAMLARTQFGKHSASDERRKERVGYIRTLFLMSVGALYLAFNVAPTEEMVLIGYKMTPWYGLVLLAFSIVIMHALVYTIGFHGEQDREHTFLHTFHRFTIVGYAVALLVSVFVLWVFGRLEDKSLLQVVMPTVVLGFPAALGAATTRLIL